MKKTIYLFAFLLLSATSAVLAQAGIAVTPGRVYYNLDEGAEGSQVIKVTNPTNTELEIGVSFNDWNYLPSGNNNIQEAGSLDNSCTDWLQVLPDTYFVLEAGETKNVEVAMEVPANVDKTLPVRTSMIFFTQLNPGKAQDQEGASIQVTVRMGVKIYHSFNKQASSELEIVDFKNFKNEQDDKVVQINVKNSGNIWTSGTVEWEIFNKNTGKTQSLAKKEFHTLPNDLREITQILPEDLESGDYTISAILTYGDSDTINIAELDFSL